MTLKKLKHNDKQFVDYARQSIVIINKFKNKISNIIESISDDKFEDIIASFDIVKFPEVKLVNRNDVIEFIKSYRVRKDYLNEEMFTVKDLAVRAETGMIKAAIIITAISKVNNKVI